MKLGRRTFLKLLGLAPVAAPVVIEAVKAAEASPPFTFLSDELVPVYDVAANGSYRRLGGCSTAFQTQYREEFILGFGAQQSLFRSALSDEG